MSTETHPVDQMLPVPRLLALGLQHALVMYAGSVAVPLIIGRALKLPTEDVVFLSAPTCSPAGWRRWCSASAFPELVFGCP